MVHLVAAMSSEETSRKGKEMAFDDDDGGDDFMQEVVERIRPFIFLNCDPRFASTLGRGRLAALTCPVLRARRTIRWRRLANVAGQDISVGSV